LGWDLYYLETYGGFGVPAKHRDGAWGLRRWMKRKDDGFVLVPLVPSDAEFHSYFADSLHWPSYSENPRAIYLPTDHIGPTWRAIILHHELGHTMFHRLNIHREKQMGHWAEEYDVYVNEIKLVRSLYGRPYSRMVYRLSKRYEPGLRKATLHIKNNKDVPHERLERVFGKPQSRLERNLQRGVVILDALYRALDRIHKDGDKKEHYEITEWLYGASRSKDIAEKLM